MMEIDFEIDHSPIFRTLWQRLPKLNQFLSFAKAKPEIMRHRAFSVSIYFHRIDFVLIDNVCLSRDDSRNFSWVIGMAATHSEIRVYRLVDNENKPTKKDKSNNQTKRTADQTNERSNEQKKNKPFDFSHLFEWLLEDHNIIRHGFVVYDDDTITVNAYRSIFGWLLCCLSVSVIVAQWIISQFRLLNASTKIGIIALNGAK